MRSTDRLGQRLITRTPTKQPRYHQVPRLRTTGLPGFFAVLVFVLFLIYPSLQAMPSTDQKHDGDELASIVPTACWPENSCGSGLVLEMLLITRSGNINEWGNRTLSACSGIPSSESPRFVLFICSLPSFVCDLSLITTERLLLVHTPALSLRSRGASSLEQVPVVGSLPLIARESQRLFCNVASGWRSVLFPNGPRL